MNMTRFKNRPGQILLILLLVMTVGLGVGLSIISRSLIDISTSTKAEQSSRAFSTAEAGIEKALRGDLTGVSFAENQSQASVYQSDPLPYSGQALEYPPVGKEEIAHFWLANPVNTPPTSYYTQSIIDVYWGIPNLAGVDQAALEVTVYYQSGGSFLSKKFFYDPNTTRITTNGFTAPDSCSNSLTPISTSSGVNRTFYCKTTLNLSGLTTLELIRARLLYTSVSQPIALQPLNGCGQACSLPPQARLFTSTGSSGDTQRTIQVFKLDQVVPFYFDYAIFSQGDITK